MPSIIHSHPDFECSRLTDAAAVITKEDQCVGVESELDLLPCRGGALALQRRSVRRRAEVEPEVVGLWSFLWVVQGKARGQWIGEGVWLLPPRPGGVVLLTITADGRDPSAEIGFSHEHPIVTAVVRNEGEHVDCILHPSAFDRLRGPPPSRLRLPQQAFDACSVVAATGSRSTPLWCMHPQHDHDGGWSGGRTAPLLRRHQSW